MFNVFLSKVLLQDRQRLICVWIKQTQWMKAPHTHTSHTHYTHNVLTILQLIVNLTEIYNMKWMICVKIAELYFRMTCQYLKCSKIPPKNQTQIKYWHQHNHNIAYVIHIIFSTGGRHFQLWIHTLITVMILRRKETPGLQQGKSIVKWIKQVYKDPARKNKCI